MNYSLSISDRVMLGMLGTSRDVGIYNIAFLVSNFLMLVFMGFNASFAPIISELYHSGKRQELRSLYSSLTRGIIIIVTPALCWLVGFGDDLLRVFGQEFVAGYVALIALCVGVSIRCAIGSVGTLLVMSGHPRYNAVNTVVVTALNIALNWVLIPRYGLAGAAIATAISIAAIDTIGLIEVRILLKILPFRRGYFKLLAAGVGALAGNLLLRVHTPPLSPIMIGLVLLGTFAVFLGLLVAMGIERDDRLIVRRALDRIRNMKTRAATR
jgi:O-antigen/teichoic acid export membrane protein